MIGFNGGLIGKPRPTLAASSVPGVWTSREQEVAVRNATWPSSALLDLYPGAVAAYGLRTLRGAVVNSAVIRVRRSSDNTEQDFTAVQISDGTLASFCGAGNGFVRTWYDQSGNSNHAAQTSTSLQPRIVNAGVVETEAGKPAIVWPTTSVGLLLSTRITTIRSYFLLAKCTNATLNSQPFLLGDSSDVDFHAGSSTWLDGSQAAAVVRNGDNRLNGNTVNFTTTNRNTTRYIFTMIPTSNARGSQLMLDRGTTVRSWIGPVQEIIIYSGEQSTTRAAIEANINAFYSVF